MIFYLLANCFSALSNAVNKFFVKNGFFSEGVRMVDVTFHANLINFFLFMCFFFIYRRKHDVGFSLRKSFINKGEILQILLFSIPIYAAVFKISALEKMPIPYFEISSMVKPFLVWLLALLLLHEKFHAYYLIYVFMAMVGFLVANFSSIFIEGYNSADGDLKRILIYLAIGAVGDITRRYYCRKWDNAMQSIFIEMFIFGLYGFLYLSIFNKFSLDVFLSPWTYIYSSLALLHHICIINGVQKAPSVAALELLNFSKNIFSLIFAALLLREETKWFQILGAFIIGVSLYSFNVTRKKKEKKNTENLENNV